MMAGMLLAAALAGRSVYALDGNYLWSDGGFNMHAIEHARKRNQRNKAQRRRRS